MVSINFSMDTFEAFLLILVRMASFMSIAPFFAQSGTPARVRVGFAFLISIIVYGMGNIQMPKYETIYGYAVIVVLESISGLLLGFSAYMCVTIISFAGRILDIDIGLSMSNLYDPTMKQQVSLSGSMYTYFVLLLMLASDMHYFLLRAIIDSFEIIPPGGMKIGMPLYTTFVRFLADYFIIGFRIILPVFAVTLIMNCIMGILTKIVPQIHMFSVGIQMKLLAGLFVMFMTVVLLPSIAEVIFKTMQELVIMVMKGMY